MIQNTINSNFLIGLINVAKLDEKTLNEIDSLKNYYLEIHGIEKYKELESLFDSEFCIDLANQNFDDDKKDLFFNISTMIAFLDEFSQKESDYLFELADKLNYSQDKLKKIISELDYETSKNLDFNLLYWFSRMIKGYVNFLKTGVTKFDAYYSFRHLHFLTNNRINLLMQFLSEVFNGFEKPVNPDENIDLITKEIKEKGYYILENLIDEKTIDKIYNFAKNQRSYPIFSDRKYSECFNNEGVIFGESENISTRYEYSLKSILSNPDILNILSDTNFTEISRQYLNSKSLLSVIHLWWTTPVKDEQDRYTGQAFHIDIDRSATLLFMIYLNDVDENNGPHVYVKGSHKNKPHNLLEDRRMSEKELIENYSKENLIEVKGKKGTVIIIDPLGFHRGKPLNIDNRLALKFEFSTDGFGELLANMKVDNLETKLVIDKLKDKYDYTYSLLS